MPLPVACFNKNVNPRPLLTSLISYWKLEEASGNRVDSHGSNTLSPNGTPGNAAGKIGNALALATASSQYLNIADNATLSVASTSFTFTGWIYLASDMVGAILSKDNEGLDREYLMYRHTDGNVYWEVFDSGGATYARALVAGPALTTWAFFAAWFDASTSKVSLSINNGAANTSGGTVTPWDGTEDFRIGAHAGATPIYFDGRIDEVGYWKRVLTANERTMLYNGGTGMQYPF